MYEVLIVEDDPMVAMLNEQYVSENPCFHVSGICRDGVSALDYLRQNAVHLVILDVYMSRADGMSLLRSIRKAEIPVSVIMVTAADDGETIEEALRLGIVDYLVKPFYSSRFAQALEKFLNIQNVFKDTERFGQKDIDALIGNANTNQTNELPKGIQAQTLETVSSYMENEGTEVGAEEIADKVGISRVTVRRYMNYLLEKGYITCRMNYETGGRPCMLYKKIR